MCKSLISLLYSFFPNFYLYFWIIGWTRLLKSCVFGERINMHPKVLLDVRHEAESLTWAGICCQVLSSPATVIRLMTVCDSLLDYFIFIIFYGFIFSWSVWVHCNITFLYPKKLYIHITRNTHIDPLNKRKKYIKNIFLSRFLTHPT